MLKRQMPTKASNGVITRGTQYAVTVRAMLSCCCRTSEPPRDRSAISSKDGVIVT